MVGIIPEKKIRYHEREISENSIGVVLKDLEKMEKKIGKKTGYFRKGDARKFQKDMAKIRVNLIGAIKPVV